MTEEISLDRIPFIALGVLTRFTLETDEIDLGNGLKIRKINNDEIRRIKEKYPVENQTPSGQIASLANLGQGVNYAIEIAFEMDSKIIDTRPAIRLSDPLLSSLRLFDRGEVGYLMFLATPTAPHPIIPKGKFIAIGVVPTNTFGDVFKLKNNRIDYFKHFWENFGKILIREKSEWIPNILLATQRFNFTYNRAQVPGAFLPDILLDSIIGLEILFGAGTEISYRVSTRVSQLIARNENERMGIFNIIRSGYIARNDITHRGNPEGIYNVGAEKWSFAMLANQMRRLLSLSIKTMLILNENRTFGEFSEGSKMKDNWCNLLDESLLRESSKETILRNINSYQDLIWTESTELMPNHGSTL